MDTKELIGKLRGISNMRSVSSFKRTICKMAAQRLERLAAYEDSGLEPEDIKRVFNEDAVLKLAGQCLNTTPDRLRELVQAEREGRSAVTPLNLGQKVWFLIEDLPYYYPDTNGWYLTEEIVTAIAANGFSTCIIDDDLVSEAWFTPFGEIGKSYFLTREEAEAALKGGDHETDSV